jgi:glycosyltransferase involved in cell wall biosynthesis
VIKFSILLPTYNCEKTIEQTLVSIKWADEILVVDSFSNDSTLDIVKEYGVNVIQHEYINSARQKNWALQYCTHDWVFQIDSDEILEPGADEIFRTAITNASETLHCYKMPRKNHVLGKWVKYGGLYPDWEYRLFRKKYGKWWNREVHSRIVVPGTIGILDTHLLHYGMPNISKQLSNLDRYTRYEADELKKGDIKFSFVKWILGPVYIFMKRYFLLQGFRDGWRGLFLAVYASFYIFLSYTKLLEIQLLKLDRSPE